MKYASVIAAVGLMLTGAAEAADKKVIVWVPNGASDFWKLAEAGMHKAQKELPNFDLQWKYPERADAAIQQRLMEDLVAAGAAAVAVSPLNPKTQAEAFNKIGSQVPLFTFDSDAADAKRVFYIGSSNVDLGKNAGELAVKAMPNGAKCMGFVGNTGADNAAGTHEGLQGRRWPQEHSAGRCPNGRPRPDPRPRQCGRHACGATRYQLHGRLLLVQPAEDYESLRDNRKLGKITVIAFDEDPITLGAVKDGSFAGTVVQQPFEWAYQGSKMFAAYLSGDKSVVPANGVTIVPGKIISKDNVDAFKADLQAKLSN